MSLDNLYGRSHPESTKFLGLFSASDLLGGNLIPQDGLENPGVYADLGRRKMLLRTHQLPDGLEMEMIGYQLNGMAVNSFLHFAAPSKFFQLDTQDIIDDWSAIVRPEQRERYLRHATKYVKPENWNMYMTIRPRLLDLIKEWWNSDKEIGNMGSVVPVARIKMESDGKINWVFDQQSMTDPNVYMPALGPLLIAAFSPDITSKWPKRHGSQDIGSTQVLPLTLEKRDDLLRGNLLSNTFSLVNGGSLNNQRSDTHEYRTEINLKKYL